MRFKTILIHSAAAAMIVLAAPAMTPVLTTNSSAQAATKVAVSIGTFYDDLAPYGDWVNHDGAYVFIPADVPARWRPYTRGHWAHTERYGWLWVSEEPFGWATYHYGRWGYAEDIGWYWVPGRQWAPAWVSWRRSADHVVWAPLPPGRGNDVSVEIAVENIPDEYWVAVPTRSFLDADISVVVIDDDRDRVRLVEAAEPAGSVTVENNIVVNNSIEIDYVEKQTQQKVKTVAVKETDDPKQAGKGGEGEVAIFNSDVKEEGEAKPKDVKDVEAVKQEQAQKKEQAPQDQAPGNANEPSGTQQDQQKSPTESQDQPAQKGTGEQQTQPEASQPESGEQQPAKKKGKAGEQSKEPDAAQPESDEQQPVKKKGKASEQPAEPEATQPESGEQQPVKKKKKSTSEPAQPEEMQPQDSQTQPGTEEPTQGNKKKPEAEPEAGAPAQEEQPAGCEPGSEGCSQ